MGIGIQGEPGGEVAQHARHRFDVHTVLQGNGSVGVAEIMESDFGDRTDAPQRASVSQLADILPVLVFFIISFPFFYVGS